MADLRSEMFMHADSLYGKAAENMDAGNFHTAEIYALCSYSIAVYLADSEDTPKTTRERAVLLEKASWEVSQQAHAAGRSRYLSKMMEPKLSGDPDAEEAESVRRDILEMVRNQSRRRNR